MEDEDCISFLCGFASYRESYGATNIRSSHKEEEADWEKEFQRKVGFEFPPMREKERSDKKKRGKRSKGRKEGKKERIRIAREERASISKGFRCKHLKEIQASL